MPATTALSLASNAWTIAGSFASANAALNFNPDVQPVTAIVIAMDEINRANETCGSARGFFIAYSQLVIREN